MERCEYMDLDLKQAIIEKEKLISGEGSKLVLSKCISCYACNAFCPNAAHPYELILSYFYHRNQQKGLPKRALYFLPQSDPNFRSYILPHLSSRDQAVLKQWKNNDPKEKEVLYPGCNLLTIPYLMNGKAFESLEIAGDFNKCCGEMYFRMGLFHKVEEISKELTQYYADHKPRKMIFICPACYNMFENVLPNQFGANFPFEKELLTDWIIRKIQSDEITISHPIEKTVTIHDSCHARVLGPKVMQSARELVSLLGMKIKEMEHNQEKGYCCGIAAGCTKFSAFDILSASKKELKEASKTNAEELASYCTGCLITFELMGNLYPFKMENYHLVEYLQIAMGEIPTHQHKKVTKTMLKGVITKALSGYLSFKHYWDY